MYSILLTIALAAAANADAHDFRIALDAWIELPCKDCDGVALGDFNGNGRMDILASSGKYTEVFWFEQGDNYQQWVKRPIYQQTDMPGEIEGNDLGDFDGDGRLEAVSLDQPNGRILLHKCRNLEDDLWETVMIQGDRPYVQASMVTDFTGDGKPELLYTWEGDRQGAGGVHLLQFIGDEVLNPEHWRDHQIMQHESAWWLLPRRLDMSGNGQAADIVYTARNIPRRNPGARPGLYWLEINAGLETPAVRHVIEDALPHPLQVAMGDLSGAGHGEDLVVGGFDTHSLYWYERSENWRRHEILLPEAVNQVAPDKIWNIKAVPLPGNRDALLAPVAYGDRGALLCFEFVDGAYRPNVLKLLNYSHPMDDRILLYDLSGNGVPEAIIPDSGPGVNRLLIIGLNIASQDD